ncbi:helicase, partial [Oryctes borbonicus]
MEDSLEDLSNSFSEQDEEELIGKLKMVDGIEPPHQRHLDVLFKIFGHKEFRPMQWKIINSIINDRRDNCAIMATGYGKSLCYQYPSVYCGGITIVISPLISLMEDQVLSLTVANIPACFLGSAQSQQKKALKDIFDNKYSIIYATPEFCCGEYGQQLLVDMDKKLSITLIAIDEAHCISSWGHDFRHQYRQLAKIRNLVPHVPILAVTATATPKVRNDIISSLQMRNPQIIYSGFDRPNLYFSVYLKENRGIIGDLRNAMTRNDGEWAFSGSTIIYCNTRKQTEQITDLLKNQGIQCLTYHAGLTIKQRREIHEQFVRDKVSVIVATIAFGMGIDKPDVRNVVHYGAAKDMESYYQEVGRAGRDGQPANCTIFYSSADLEVLRSLRELSYATEMTIKQKEAMVQNFWRYLETTSCRRQFILRYFGDTSSIIDQAKLNCCDNCTRKLKQKNPVEYEEVNSNGLIDITDYAHTFLSSIAIMGSGLGLNTYILFIRGSKGSKMPEKHQSHPLHGSGKHKTDDWWKCIARLLEHESYFKKQTVKRPTYSYCCLSLTNKGKQFLQDVLKDREKVQILVEPPPDLRVLLKKKNSTPYDPCWSSQNSAWIKPDSSNLVNTSNDKSDIQHNKKIVDIEDESQKEERMKIYRELLNKRSQLASDLNCMPYMIASNEILMNLARLRPRTMDMIRELKLDGFTEAKINKFGEEFIGVIRPFCPVKNKKSIQDILAEHPFDNTMFSPTTELTYNMFKNVKSIEDIANARKLAPSTILSHLTNCMKLGYPIKLKDLNVSNTVKEMIIGVLRRMSPSEDKKFIWIKDRCPEEVTFDKIKA